MNNNNEIITYHYKFTLSNGVEREFNIKLDKNLNLITARKKSYPEWTKLKDFKCPHCPLDENGHEFCPITVNLVDIVDFFRDASSYEEVGILIETEERGYVKHTTLQDGISSLVGIYMVTSGCPILEKLKPMVRYHLPFSTLEETKYRAISMYLLAQYFLYKRGKKPDWELKNLVKIYDDIQIVNKNFCEKLSNLKINDASLNALVKLDCFASYVSFSIEINMLDGIELLFNPYFD